jgi:hypothetical protein
MQKQALGYVCEPWGVQERRQTTANKINKNSTNVTRYCKGRSTAKYTRQRKLNVSNITGEIVDGYEMN